MSRKICEKTIYNVLFFRHNTKLINRMLLDYGCIPGYTEKTLNWEKLGFDDWYNNTDGPLGMEQEVANIPPEPEPNPNTERK
jgi:hypothetical protein